MNSQSLCSYGWNLLLQVDNNRTVINFFNTVEQYFLSLTRLPDKVLILNCRRRMVYWASHVLSKPASAEWLVNSPSKTNFEVFTNLQSKLRSYQATIQQNQKSGWLTATQQCNSFEQLTERCWLGTILLKKRELFATGICCSFYSILSFFWGFQSLCVIIQCNHPFCR